MQFKKILKHASLIAVVAGLTLFVVLLTIFKQTPASAFTISQNPYYAGSFQPLALSCDGLNPNGDPRSVSVYFSNNNENEMPFYTTNCTDTGIGIYLDNNYNGPIPRDVYIMQQDDQSCVGFSSLSCHNSRMLGEFILTYTNVIPTPTPTSAPPPPQQGSSLSSSNTGTINVVKTVINDNGRNKVVSDFPLFINGQAAVSGQTYTFPALGDVFTVTETGDSNYTLSFSGDCDANGQTNLSIGDNKFCIVTNDDVGAPIVVPPIPPLIDVVKVPAPLALPGGPGPVLYTYTLRNIGTVPVTDVTMVGDTCNPIVLSSGDTNGDSRLDVTETWTYTCSTNLSVTHTNTVTATGWANGISAIDVASSTVVVGNFVPALPDAGIVPILKIVPPLIHVTKVPSTLAFLAGGGVVLYTNKVTNPGVVALSNVRLTDDKCGPVKYISGDKDGDSKLDTTETWTYTCQEHITETTTNTVIAEGRANGFTVRDLAVVTVVVADIVPGTAIPALPNAGPALDAVVNIFWALVILVAVIVLLILFYENRKNRQVRK